MLVLVSSGEGLQNNPSPGVHDAAVTVGATALCGDLCVCSQLLRRTWCCKGCICEGNQAGIPEESANNVRLVERVQSMVLFFLLLFELIC